MKPSNTSPLFPAALLGLSALAAMPFAARTAENSPPRLPVREVTVFKDGHAFVMREGTLVADRNGEVTLDDLPEPVVGTFWAYALGGQLRGVTAGRRLASEKMDALNLRDLIKANIGAQVTVIKSYDKQFDATILSVPQAPPSAAIAAVESPDERYRRFQNQAGDQIVLLQTEDGVRVRALNSMKIFSSMPFPNSPSPKVSARPFRW